MINFISLSFEKFKAEWIDFVLVTLLVIIINVVVNFILNILFAVPVNIIAALFQRQDISVLRMLGGLVSAVGSLMISFLSFGITGPIMVGYCSFLLKKVRNQGGKIEDVISGFTEYLVPSLIAGIVLGVINTIATILCVIPVFITATLTAFTYFFIADGEVDFKRAIMNSVDMVKQRFFPFFGFLILCGIISVAGVIACCIGVLATVPIAACAMAFAYEEYRSTLSSSSLPTPGPTI